MERHEAERVYRHCHLSTVERLMSAQEYLISANGYLFITTSMVGRLHPRNEFQLYPGFDMSEKYDEMSCFYEPTRKWRAVHCFFLKRRQSKSKHPLKTRNNSQCATWIERLYGKKETGELTLRKSSGQTQIFPPRVAAKNILSRIFTEPATRQQCLFNASINRWSKVFSPTVRLKSFIAANLLRPQLGDNVYLTLR
jgi:hypothetical protein